jgi:hypothetical protein
MGERQVDEASLFYEFSLERHVPATHLLRSIDRFVDLPEVRNHLAPFYSSTGRPSIDPDLPVCMLLVGYCYGTPLRKAASRGSSPEPRLPLVLSARRRWRGAGPLNLLQELAWPLP